MKTKTLYYVGGAIAAYFLYKTLAAPSAGGGTAPGLVAGGPPGAMSSFGAYGTGNPMLEELGSLGCSGSQVPGVKGY